MGYSTSITVPSHGTGTSYYGMLSKIDNAPDRVSACNPEYDGVDSNDVQYEHIATPASADAEVRQCTRAS